MKKNLSKILVLSLIPLSVASCNSKDLGALPMEEISPQEVFISRNYNRHWGYCQGSRNGYISYGKTPLGEVGGIGVAPDHRFRFRIKQLVERFPEADSPEVQKAILRQEKELF